MLIAAKGIGWKIAALALLVAFSTGAFSASPIEVASPNGNLVFSLKTDSPRLSFSVTYKTTPVLQSSPMLMNLDNIEITAGAAAGAVERYSINETYPWLGIHNPAVDQSNGARIAMKKGATSYTLELRAFNDAVAFRTLIPGAPSVQRVPMEWTTFTLPSGCTVWFHDTEGHYEGIHQKSDVSSVTAGQWVAPPMTFKLPGGAGYASITEAALFGYAGMALHADGKRGFGLTLGHAVPPSYPYRLRYSIADQQRLAIPAVITGPITTPWRVVMFGADLNTLVNCDALQNLCPPPDKALYPEGAAASWIRPGRAVWRYLDGGANTYDGITDFSRLAGLLGFEHQVVEGLWRNWTDAQIRQLVTFSNQQGKGVGLFVWLHSGDLDEWNRAENDPGAIDLFGERSL